MNEFNPRQKLANRPGLSALIYRLGDYHAFRHYLLNRLSVRLPSLTARERDDFGIALIDAWALVADVLTFYQERIANEGYLRTATEMRSVLELARSIGYEFKPGAAASTYLAFTVEDRPETLAGVEIPPGTQVMSIPQALQESPQTFETSEAILARPDWNALKPRTSKPPEITNSTLQLYLQGISSQLAVGDPILLVGEVEQTELYYLRFLTTVEPTPAAGYTLIAWEQPLPLPPQTFLRHLQVFAFRLQASLFGHNAPRWQEMPSEIKRQAGGTFVGGVFRSSLAPITWETASEGLPNQDILCLASKDKAGYVFAGTAGRGIFRYQTSDGQWKAVNTGLTNLTVQTLLVDARGHIFAGTPSGGVFRSKDNGENWVPISTGTVSVQFQGTQPGEPVNTGLPNTVIRSLLAYESGDNYYIFAGTDDSIYRTTDGGQNWYSEKTPTILKQNLRLTLEGLPDRIVNALSVVEKEQFKARGRITAINSTTIEVEIETGNLVKNDIIIVGDQARIINSVSGNKLTINKVFSPDIKSSISFFSPPPITIFAGTDKGVYRSINHGESWEKINGGLTEEKNANKVLAVAILTIHQNQIFAGTEEGIFLFDEASSNWQRLNKNGLEDTNIQALIVSQSGKIFAGTKKGIFYLENNTNNDWQESYVINPQVKINITNLQISKLQLGGNQEIEIIFAGTRFVGFVEDKPQNSKNLEVTKEAEWPDFQLKANEIDLDTLYPKIVNDSWLLLVDKQKPEPNNTINLEPDIAALLVEEVIKVPRKAFTIDAKISRIVPKQLIENPEKFGLRTTTIFAQSEKLDLVEDPVTVTAKQHQIFLDPIWDNKIFLQQFAQGLTTKKPLLVSGKRMRAKINAGGFFLSKNWQKTPESDITNTEIEAMTINGEGEIFIATKDGVFRSSDRGVNWQSINQGLENKTVTCLLAYSKPGVGTVGKRLGSLKLNNYLDNPNIPQEDIGLQVGDTITVEQQTRIVEEIDIESFQSNINYKFVFTINAEFISSIPNYSGYTFNKLIAGTDKGIFRFNEATQNWEPASQEVQSVQVIAFNRDSGHIFAGTQKGLFRSLDHGQSWEILDNKDNIIEDDLLNAQDIRSLAVSGEYIFAGTSNGKIFWLSNTNTENLPVWKYLNINPNFIDKVVQSLAFQPDASGGRLFVGLKEGIISYQYHTNGNTLNELANDSLHPQLNENIRCLTVNGDYIFVGTETGGAFCLKDSYWWAINAGLNNQSVGLFALNPQIDEELWIGTAKGIFYTQDNGRNFTNLAWKQSNQDLTYTSVQTLTWYREAGTLYLFVGTREGIFRSRNYGENWEAINQGLSNRNIQALVVVKNPTSDTPYLLAGTANGIFRSSDGGRNWQQSMQGLSSPNVQVMAVKNEENSTIVFAGTLEGGVFIAKDWGENWKPTALTQQKIQTLAIVPNNIPKDSRLKVGSILAGTREGIFYSSDNGNNWQQWADSRPESGTISSNNITITGNKTDFPQLKKSVGQVKITAASQTRRVISIDSNDAEILTVDLPFRPELSPETPFSLSTGLENLNVTALVIDAQGCIFAGTGGSGIFCSEDGGQWWKEINTGLTNREIRCLFADNNTGEVLAGAFSQKTLENGEILPIGGVFRLKKGDTNWEAREIGMTNTEVRAIASDGVNLLVGGTGILLAPEGFYTVPLEAADWLEVVSPPVIIGGEPVGGQKWQVCNRDGFVGNVATITAEEISLYAASEEGETISEFCTLQTDLEDQQQPILSLDSPLKYSYDPETVKIYANVVIATHGETVSEILGSGDGSTTNQKFALQKLPLTYTLDPTVGSTRSTLKVYINDVQWTEVPSLYSEGVDSRSQCYMIRLSAEGITEIVFGDGEEGVRPPSGLENIRAIYRSGIGSEGNVDAGSLSLLKTRPLGVVEVINPLPASGGDQREGLATARDRAPASVRTLGRIVSLRDFADFALTFPGIGKAQAVPLWDGRSQFLHLTVAGIDGTLVPPESLLYVNLVEAIAAVGNPTQRVQVDSYEPRYFRLEAKVILDTNYKADKVLAEIEFALKQAFSFAVREFGQPVTEAEAIATMRNVPGVVAVALDALYLRGASKADNSGLVAAIATWDNEKQRVQPAQLLLLDDLGITLSSVTTL